MKTLVVRAVHNIKQGEPVKEIISYWLPELISAMILITLPPIIDSYIVANSQSVTSYGALAMATNFLHMLIKFAEAIPVAAVAIIGRHNGAKEYKKCGEDLGNTFWTTTLLGLAQFSFVMFSASYIYQWLNVPQEMISIGAHFLRLKSFGVLLIFILLSFIYFMRGIKNTRIPMLINLVGVATFIFFDYALVLGKFGFTAMNLNGSAYATIIQYAVMIVIAISYILFNPDYKKYFNKIFFSIFNFTKVLHLLNLSWPIMLDKLSFAMAYVWLSKLIATMGTNAITTYDVVKNLERFAFVPAMAFAVVITFLVSNRLGQKDLDGASANIKKILFLTFLTTGSCLAVLCLYPHYFVSLFDPNNTFTEFAATVLPIISVLVVFDLTQVILAGALRGSGDVKTVMYARIYTIFGLFFPISYYISTLQIENPAVKFSLLYGAHYLNTGLISFIFFRRILSHKWQKKEI